MPKYLYNGVELPALPEWDRERFPYAWVEYTGLYIGYFFVSKTPLCATGNTFNNYLGDLGQEAKNDAAEDLFYVKFPRSTWEDQSQIWLETTRDGEKEFVASLPGDPVDGAYDTQIGLNMFTVFWTNHDVVSEDGTVYLAASDPVPVEPDFDLDSWLIGYVMGLVSEPLPLGLSNIVACKYNGVQLAPLPKYDTEAYPYAAIVYDSFWGADLVVSTVPLIYNYRVFFGYYLAIPSGITAKAIHYRHQGDGLHELALVGPFVINKIVEVEETNTSSKEICGNYQEIIWSNYDIYSNSGNLNFATNDSTIPVYGVFFNGILKPPLPEWDQNTYPYITMLQNSREHWLAATKEPPYFDGNTICFTDGTEQLSWTSLPNAVTWYEYDTGWKYEHPDEHYEFTPYIPVWSNTDILNTNGSVYLAASKPIPMCKPISYLYNGVQLPKLPEWDKQAYPYAVITHHPESGSTILTCGSYPVTVSEAYIYYNGTTSRDIWVPCATFTLTSNKWGNLTIENNSYGFMKIADIVYAELVWSNHDVLKNTDGSVYLAASEPVPVYE